MAEKQQFLPFNYGCFFGNEYSTAHWNSLLNDVSALAAHPTVQAHLAIPPIVKGVEISCVIIFPLFSLLCIWACTCEPNV